LHPYTLAAIAVFLLASAIFLVTMHLRSWRKSRAQQLDTQELEFRRRQFRRRMQSSFLLGVMGVAIFFGPWIKDPSAALAFWAVAILVILWVAALAVADVAATRSHFHRLREQYMIEQSKLQAEIRRIQSARSNGKSRGEKG